MRSMSKLFFCAVFSVAALGGCSIYQNPVNQGNIIAQEQVNRLRVGMSRNQVQQILGNPLLQDIFHASRWDYPFRTMRGGKLGEQRTLTVEFDDKGYVKSWRGDDQPTEAIQNRPRTLAPAPSAAQLSATTSPPSVQELAQLARPAAPVPTSQVAIAPAQAVVAPAIVAAPARQDLTVASRLLQNNQAADTQSADLKQLEQLVENWRTAWAEKKTVDYVASYTAEFKGTSANRNAWLEARKKSIESKKWIKVALSDVKIIRVSENEARAMFNQNYESDVNKEAGQKRMYFKKINGKWLIDAEFFTKA